MKMLSPLPYRTWSNHILAFNMIHVVPILIVSNIFLLWVLIGSLLLQAVNWQFDWKNILGEFFFFHYLCSTNSDYFIFANKATSFAWYKKNDAQEGSKILLSGVAFYCCAMLHKVLHWFMILFLMLILTYSTYIIATVRLT